MNQNQKFFTYWGTISEVGQTQEIEYTKDGQTGKFFKKVITVNCAVGEGEWMRNMDIPFEVNGKALAKVKGFSKGEDVKVDFFITAKSGFVNLKISKLEKAGSNQEPATTEGLGLDPNDDSQDLPF